ncbi:MAG TPA: hypothetical protein VFU15_04520, partial [Bacteroidia bacterium]|nr:hypothetical protein [Bacteroidia bacterium]
MKRTLLPVFALMALPVAGLHAQMMTDSLNYTGGIQTYTVPCGVTSITIECYGAQGGSGATGGNSSTG